MNIRNSTLKTLVPTIVLALGLAATAGASEQVRSIRVGYSDLDLSSVTGAQALHQRIKNAAKEVCGYYDRSLAEQRAWNDCYHGALDEAVAKVNSPLLTAVHTGQPVSASTVMLTR